MDLATQPRLTVSGSFSILVAANWFLALTGGMTFGLLVLRTRIEEEKLIERFGEDYKEYMKRTGRFLPRLFQT